MPDGARRSAFIRCNVTTKSANCAAKTANCRIVTHPYQDPFRYFLTGFLQIRSPIIANWDTKSASMIIRRHVSHYTSDTPLISCWSNQVLLSSEKASLFSISRLEIILDASLSRGYKVDSKTAVNDNVPTCNGFERLTRVDLILSLLLRKKG